MERENVLIKLFSLFESFIQQLSLPAELVDFTFCREKLLKGVADEITVLGHLSRLVEEIKSLKSHCDKNEGTDPVGMSPKAKKMKIEDDHEDKTVSDNIEELDTSLIQVNASKAEIDRRISAFMQRKRLEVDLLNKREFCSIIDTENNNEFSCARVDAVFVHRHGQKSHIKVTQVENTSSASEAQALGPEFSKQRTPVASQIGMGVSSCHSTEERIRNIEIHLGYRPERPVPQDVYERLSDLEKRILHLEGLSPEYFRKNPDKGRDGIISSGGELSFGSTQNLTLDEIDERIRSLRHSLSKGISS
ncbi:unnamed protein product [Pocillopora meandrina]|uniref:MAP3K12-binding inhibitory protein 1 n=1 Tax=Pocillopora meandrina TaxID=46732 RepID=A0AAU9W3T2_9CNID|nr:unnamed protein product [Pocillopora meandrina]